MVYFKIFTSFFFREERVGDTPDGVQGTNSNARDQTWGSHVYITSLDTIQSYLLYCLCNLIFSFYFIWNGHTQIKPTPDSFLRDYSWLCIPGVRCSARDQTNIGEASAANPALSLNFLRLFFKTTLT